MEMSAIRTEGLTKRYGNVDALKDLDLEVTRGRYWDTSDPTVRARQQPFVCCWD